jgi:glucose/arabinose dehydrogenase
VHGQGYRRGAVFARATLTAALAAMAVGLLPVAASAPAVTATAGNPVTEAGGAAVPQVVLGTPILTGLSRPVLFIPRGPTHSTGYVVEQTGYIIRVTYNATTHAWTNAGVFLDIHARVTDPNGASAGEQGLLGLAFPPEFDAKGRFYVYYTARSDGADTISQFKLASPTRADPNSERKVLAIPDPYPNHNGGMMLFAGHNLLVGIGDGGSGGDPGNRAQNLRLRLGKILRIDPRDPDRNGPKHYSVPADNPFVGVPNVKPEVWAYGLRNPWRWSIDPPTGDLWIGDVGQCQYEEVDHAGNARGVNFGWRRLEGNHVYSLGDCNAPEPVCSSNCETLPVAEYDHSSTGSCSVTGGWVYRGNAYPAWRGKYLYGDFCSGKMWIISASGAPGVAQDVTPTAGGISVSSFARDDAGELYAVDLGGSIYALQLTGTP